MMRFIMAELDVAGWDLYAYDENRLVKQLRSIPYFELLTHLDMRIKPDDVIVYAPLYHFPYTQTGAQYKRMRDG